MRLEPSTVSGLKLVVVAVCAVGVRQAHGARGRPAKRGCPAPRRWPSRSPAPGRGPRGSAPRSIAPSTGDHETGEQGPGPIGRAGPEARSPARGAGVYFSHEDRRSSDPPLHPVGPMSGVQVQSFIHSFIHSLPHTHTYKIKISNKTARIHVAQPSPAPPSWKLGLTPSQWRLLRPAACLRSASPRLPPPRPVPDLPWRSALSSSFSTLLRGQ